jgi:hypothetical protein
MKRILRSTKDTYITNRIIRNQFRATDANVGQAGTLDLFKLAGESTFSGAGPFITGTFEPIELSRILIKFDLTPLSAMTSSILNVTHPSFKCTLKLIDVMGGQTLPSNFSLILYPLAQAFDEGIGRDVNAFEDIDVANYITASISNGLTAWFMSGASGAGYVGESNIDYITGSTALGDLFAVQTFTEGDEDISMDVTKIVSATLTGQIPNHGFRISFSGTQETDDRTRFVKRFATRHSTDPRLRPSIEVGFNDSIHDHHKNFFFDTSGSLFLNNFRRGIAANIVSGVSLTPITGPNSIILTLVSGNYTSGAYFTKIITASQHTIGSNSITGVYSASFAISPYESGTLSEHVTRAHSATFTEIWGSLDGTVGYYTGSLVVYDFDRSAFSNAPDRLKVTATNIKSSYKLTERVRVRIFAQDMGFNMKATKLPFEAQSLIFDNMHYRLTDVNKDEIIYDFDLNGNSTQLSTDEKGMYFDLYMTDLDVGSVYTIDILLDTHGSSQVFKNVGGSFRIDP